MRKKQPRADRKIQFRGAFMRVHHTKRFNPVRKVSLSVLNRFPRFSTFAADRARPAVRHLTPGAIRGFPRMSFRTHARLQPVEPTMQYRFQCPPTTFVIIHYATNTLIGRHPLYSIERRNAENAAEASARGARRARTQALRGRERYTTEKTEGKARDRWPTPPMQQAHRTARTRPIRSRSSAPAQAAACRLFSACAPPAKWRDAIRARGAATAAS